jgi:type VI secretion system protein ImpF
LRDRPRLRKPVADAGGWWLSLVKMLRIDNEVRITPSVLDRLLDDEPEVSREPLASRSENLRQLKQAVKRDLEWLLNTRRVADELPQGLKELHNSLAAYGLPDFTNASIKSPSDQSRLRRAIETAVSAFEPRLEDVTVALVPADGRIRTMSFRIDARLKIEPAPEPITFDTMLQLDNGRYTVREE